DAGDRPKGVVARSPMAESRAESRCLLHGNGCGSEALRPNDSQPPEVDVGAEPQHRLWSMLLRDCGEVSAARQGLGRGRRDRERTRLQRKSRRRLHCRFDGDAGAGHRIRWGILRRLERRTLARYSRRLCRAKTALRDLDHSGWRIAMTNLAFSELADRD